MLVFFLCNRGHEFLNWLWARIKRHSFVDRKSPKRIDLTLVSNSYTYVLHWCTLVIGINWSLWCYGTTRERFEIEKTSEIIIIWYSKLLVRSKNFAALALVLSRRSCARGHGRAHAHFFHDLAHVLNFALIWNSGKFSIYFYATIFLRADSLLWKNISFIFQKLCLLPKIYCVL